MCTLYRALVAQRPLEPEHESLIPPDLNVYRALVAERFLEPEPCYSGPQLEGLPYFLVHLQLHNIYIFILCI
jgi:hypothetical protein